MAAVSSPPLPSPPLLSPSPPPTLQAREGTLAIEDMDGGTFTISNGGVFGSLYGTPIINPPQSAILGMHATVDRPVAVHGKVADIWVLLFVCCFFSFVHSSDVIVLRQSALSP